MNLREQLCRVMRGNMVVLGIGNPMRGDDAAGSCLAQRICAAPGVHVIDAQDVPENYLCPVVEQQPDTVLLIDAVDLHRSPGSVALIDRDEMTAYWPSTHRVPMGLLVDYLERTTHARILLLAIQPRQTDVLQPMSSEVLSTVEAIADVLNDVSAKRGTLATPEYVRLPGQKVPA